ncbi:MAG: HesA/MoeB/ThiF family protein [Deltaproteobacteria bacterium]|nr:MAG: HesA/MoeB/ThiF family protein [Deltaproteobacteria bacterium]
MSQMTQTELHQLIQTRSKIITDQAGREVLVLDDDQAFKIGGESRRTVHEVYTEALRLGINPYRYIRNRELISVQEQLRLAESRVTVVGAGGLGGQVILLLARVGIGHLIVVDPDLFDETNLNRQALCSRKSLGRPKSKVAVDVVASINPGIKVTPYQTGLDPLNAPEILVGSDVVVDALDNIPDRLVLESTTKQLGVPLVHGALAGFEGWMMTIFPDDEGLKCLYGDGEVKGNDAKSPEAILGVPALTPSMFAALQAMEVLKIILKRGKIFRHTIVHLDLETGQLNEFVCEKRNSLKSD